MKKKFTPRKVETLDRELTVEELTVARAIAKARFFRDYGERLTKAEVDGLAHRCANEASAAIAALDRHRNKRGRVVLRLTEGEAWALYLMGSEVMDHEDIVKNVFHDGRQRRPAVIVWNKLCKAIGLRD